MIHLYILKGKDDWYYCGITKDLTKRMKQHNSGESKSTSERKPYDIKYLQTFEDYKQARRKEKLIKNQGIKNWYMRNIYYKTR